MVDEEKKPPEPNDDECLYILQKIEDMFSYSYPLLERWSVREMRAIGNRIFDCMNDMLEYATSIRFGFYKKTDISALDKRNHQLQTYIKVAYEVKALKGLSGYKEWTRRSEEIGKMIGGFINAVYDGNPANGNTANQKQKHQKSGGSRYYSRK